MFVVQCCSAVTEPVVPSPTPAIHRSLMHKPRLLAEYEAGEVVGLVASPRTGRLAFKWRCRCGSVIVLRCQRADRRAASGLSWKTEAIARLMAHLGSLTHEARVEPSDESEDASSEPEAGAGAGAGVSMKDHREGETEGPVLVCVWDCSSHVSPPPSVPCVRGVSG